MGLKSETVFAVCVLGISLTCVEFMFDGMMPDAKKPLTSATIVAPTDVQLDWKKQAENLSGPKALSGCMAKRACLISSADGMEVSDVFVAADIHGVRALRTVAAPSCPAEVKMDLK